MRPYRLLIHALLFPCIYIGFQLIKIRPAANEYEQTTNLSWENYYVALAIFLLTILVAFYGSFLTRRMKRVSLDKRRMVAVAFIVCLVLVEGSLIYYLNTVSGPSFEPLT